MYSNENICCWEELISVVCNVFSSSLAFVIYCYVSLLRSRRRILLFLFNISFVNLLLNL